MTWLKITFLCIGIAAAFALGFSFEELQTIDWRTLAGSVTGAAIVETRDNTTAPRTYAWTTALCGGDGRCIDIHVECNGSQILNVTPVSNIVWHTDDWQDPRGGNPGQLCTG